jgi:hypothetical protein
MTTLFNVCLPALAIAAGSTLLAIASPPGDAVRAPAPSLARPDSDVKGPDADGFMQRWMILEPIRVNAILTDHAVQALIKTNYYPDQLTVLPHDGDKVTVNGTELAWHGVDTKNFNVNLYHFAYALDKPTSSVLFWAVTIVNCPEEMSGVRLAIGSNSASIWWVNGEEVIHIYGDRQSVIDDGVSKRLTLKKGKNIVRCAVINGAGATDFCARFLDREDKPMKAFTLSVGDAAR